MAYLLGRIYKLYNNTFFYIGSTFSSLSKRLSQHRDFGRKLKCNSLLYLKMNELGANNFKIELIEELEVIDKKELREREEYYISLLNPNLNKDHATGLTEEELIEYRKKYYEDNKDKLLEQNKIYRTLNNKIINEKRREKKQCDKCKKYICKGFFNKHYSVCDGTDQRKKTGRKKGDKTAILNLNNFFTKG